MEIRVSKSAIYRPREEQRHKCHAKVRKLCSRRALVPKTEGLLQQSHERSEGDDRFNQIYSTAEAHCKINVFRACYKKIGGDQAAMSMFVVKLMLKPNARWIWPESVSWLLWKDYLCDVALRSLTLLKIAYMTCVLRILESVAQCR